MGSLTAQLPAHVGNPDFWAKQFNTGQDLRGLIHLFLKVGLF